MATPKKQSKSVKADAKSDPKADKPAHIAPVVNLTNAAQSAAMLLAARRKRAEAEGDSGTAATTGGHLNAAAFKHLKEGVHQPQFSSSSPLAGLNKPAKPTGSPGFTKHLGQSHGNAANVARTGVPRRTSGG